MRRPDELPRQTMSLWTTEQLGRYSEGSHNNRWLLDNTHWSWTKIQDDCVYCGGSDEKKGEGNGSPPRSV